ncbi:MAG: hypothetical protein KJ838_02040 [Candidatus Omnitrophica bacterium]|nr:hypothetical protein [Candidatus Omnitrophota bacterium]
MSMIKYSRRRRKISRVRAKPCYIAFSLAVLFYLLISGLVFCFAEEAIVYEDKGRRDPFIALVTPDGRLLNLEPVGSERKIVLEGIIYDPKGPSYVIINDQILSVGDFISGQAIFKIEENKVILLKDNQPVELILDKGGE